MTKHKSGEVIYYTSALLDKFGIKHGWFARTGGFSPKPYDSLNFSRNHGDNSVNVDKNRSLACSKLGLKSNNLVFAGKLGHSNKILQASPKFYGKEVSGYDALFTTQKNVPLGLAVADCVAIFIADVHGQVVSVVHVGWKGLVAGVIQHSVNEITKLGIRYSDLVSAIGPANQVETYEFSESDLGPINRVFPSKQITKQVSSKWYVDIPKGCEIKLRDCGISKIENLGINSFLDRKEFFSYRAEQPTTGRNGAIVSL